MKDINDPKIVYTLPYFTYLKFQRWKFYFWALLTVGVVSPIFMMNLALVTAIIPKPLMNHILGITPEMERQQAERDVLIDRRERFEKAEAIRNKAIAEQRKAAYNAESAVKSQAELDAIVNKPQTSDEAVRWQTFH